MDYLLKPFSRKRFRDTLGRVRRRAEQPEQERAARLEHVMRERSGHPELPQRLLVESEPNREILLDVADIELLRARRNYVELVTARGSFLRRGTLQAFEERLDENRFLRINRSEIVRLDAVREFQPWYRGDYRVVLERGDVLTWSRRYRAQRKGDFEIGPPREAK